jgi:gluconate 2-dehydrogenase gamma chain
VLLAEGIVEVSPASDGSVYQEYVITKKGRALLPTLVALAQWSSEYLFDRFEVRFVPIDAKRRAQSGHLPWMALRALRSHPAKISDARKWHVQRQLTCVNAQVADHPIKGRLGVAPRLLPAGARGSIEPYQLKRSRPLLPDGTKCVLLDRSRSAMSQTKRVGPSRRALLLCTATLFVAGTTSARARIIAGHLPWVPNAGNPPAAKLGPWEFFSGEEGRAMEALADRIIPPDPQTPGGKDAGCAVFVDRQLAGSYGKQDGLYLRPPFQAGLQNQGHQSEGGPRQQYRQGLAALDRACKSEYAGKAFAELSDGDKDMILKGLESGDLKRDGADGKSFFEQAIRDVQMGFFADPIYGGNRDMVGWRMIGYPGARYNYLDWVNRHNERFPLPPVSITGRAEWTPQTR